MPGHDGKPLTISFELDGLRFTALNGGPKFRFNESISFAVSCKDQEEIDLYWSRLISNGGQESACGWLKDRYGLSWQIVPENLPDLLKRPGAMPAMMKMKKLVIADLQPS